MLVILRMRMEFIMTGLKIWIAFAVALTGYASEGLAADCPLLKAVYAPLDPEDDMSADAGKQNQYRARHIATNGAQNQAQYMLRIVEEKQNISYDFSYAYPNGYGGTALVFMGDSKHSSNHKMKSSDPGSSIFYFNDQLHAATPEQENPGSAPKYLMMPGLGGAFWYWEKGMRKFVPPAGLWAQISCDK